MKRQQSPWLRFGLRSLLLLMVGLALVGAMPAHWLAEGRRQQQLAGRLREAGCSVEFSHWRQIAVQPARPKIFTASPASIQHVTISTLPAWMETAGLSPAFRRVERVTIRHGFSSTGNEVLACLAGLERVPTISVYDRTFDAPSLQRLLDSVEVRQLYVSGVQLSEGRLGCLARSKLTWLCVAQTRFSNPAIQDLPETLEYFDATRTRINDRALRDFERLTNLEILILRRTPTTEEAVERLRARMPWCEIRWEPLKRP